MGRSYDPFEHAAAENIDVHYRRLRTGNGLWVPDHRIIFLTPKMRRIHERSILAHEVGHAVHAHRDDGPKNEGVANRYAAQNLLDYEEVADMMRWTDDEIRICLELGVTVKLFRVYAEMMNLSGQQEARNGFESSSESHIVPA